MNHRSLKQWALATTLLTGAALSAPALAQEEGEQSDTTDRIVVTGSRLVASSIDSVNPVISVDAAAFKQQGVSDVVDLVNTIPGIEPAQTTDISNGASGASTIDLRGLGATRNLLLIDGHRLPAGNATSTPGGAGYASDANLVPAALIDRVEVVTGGSSAVYGSDAVSGVTNFILRRDFEGIEINARAGWNVDSNDNDRAQEWLENSAPDGVVPTDDEIDGRKVDFSVIMGTSLPDDRGNVTGYVQYIDQREVLQGTRDHSRCATSQDFSGRQDDGGVICLGSNFGPFPTTFSLSPITDPSTGLPLDPQPGSLIEVGDTVSLDENGNIPRDADGNIVTGATNAYNFNPTNFFQRPFTRWNGGFMARYEVTDNVEAYMDFGFTDNITDAQIAPSATFGEITQINCNNPFLSPELQTVICTDRGLSGDDLAPVQINRRGVESGGRNSRIELTNFRFVGGLRGEVVGWDYDVFAQHAVTRQTDTNTNDFQIDLFQEALLVEEDANGNLVCTSGRDGCQPLNLFGTTPVDPEALAAVAVPSIVTGRIEQTVFGGTLSNDLGEYGIVSPFADEGVQMLVGAEYREDALQNTPDSILRNGNATGLGGPTSPVDGETNVWEVFTEANVPLIQGGVFAEELTFTGAYRYSDYSATDRSGPTPVTGLGEFQTDTYAAGLVWSPVEDVRFRAQYQRAVRAPNIFNLFSAQVQQLFPGSDPCSGSNPTASVSACEASGLDPSLYGLVPPDAGQLNELSGGNPDLEPETADTTTLGVVYTPQFAPNLRLSVDYFNIEIEDFISSIPGTQIISGCIDEGNEEFCDLFNRDSLGTIQINGDVEATLQNIAAYNTSGFDFQANYRFDATDVGLPDIGGFVLNYIGTYTEELEFQSLPTTEPFDCAGFYGDTCGTPFFEYSHNATATWQSNFNVDVTLTWRHLGEVSAFGYDPETGSFPGTFQWNPSFDAQNYFDLFANWNVRDNVSLNAGVNNLLNEDPPIDDFSSTDNGNTYPGVYPATGRYVFFGASVNY